jgi:Tol biopolymer transport system component
MLRLKILASVVPLVIVAVLARGGWSPGPHPCIAIGDASVEIASVPWHADLHVSFTDDPKAATVRVQISESAEAADFAVVDDVDSPQTGASETGAPETGACKATAAPLSVAIAASRSGSAPVIYLSKNGPADYRIFVRSKTFTARDAAALIVGAGDGHHHLTAASL